MKETLHPLVRIWLGTNRWSEPNDRILPWSGGWLDWDLHETKGMEWLEDLVDEIKSANQRREEQKSQATQNQFWGNVPQG